MPPGLSVWSVCILLASSVGTAFISTALGLGGGVLLLAIMTLFLPVVAVIPLHGVIQLGSNAGRAVLGWRRVQFPVLAAFGAGCIGGTVLGAQVLRELPPGWLEVALGTFIAWTCLGRLPAISAMSRGRIAAGGAITGALTLFVGATGPLVATLIRALRLDRRAHVRTFAACMVVQHGLKIAVFGLAGFVYAPYAGFLAAMIGVGLLGTWLGGHVLERMREQVFQRLLTLLLLLLAARLLYVGLREVMIL